MRGRRPRGRRRWRRCCAAVGEIGDEGSRLGSGGEVIWRVRILGARIGLGSCGVSSMLLKEGVGSHTGSEVHGHGCLFTSCFVVA